MRVSWTLLEPIVIASLLAFTGTGCRGEANHADVATARAAASTAAAQGTEQTSKGRSAAQLGDRRLGRGFVVWESNRSGRWRIWTRRLDGSDLRQLSPNEPGRNHCCAHIAPDGSWVTYLSFEGAGREYPTKGPVGQLHVIRPEGGGDRVIATAARTYFENRAAVWRDSHQLIYIDGEGFTVQRDLRGGGAERLTRKGRDRHGWLIDPSLRFAVDGSAAFSPYDAKRKIIAARAPLGGCEPYFTADGRWGYWSAGAGGPINRIDLESRVISTILEKNDPRLGSDYGYLYFPMTSPDQRLLAWAASRGGHDHFTVDYEVFVAPIDPESLELVGTPVRMTRNKATDRYPDAFLEPLPLGRHQGEAPFTVQFKAPDPGNWKWDFGDGAATTGTAVQHTWSRPGGYRVVARRGNASQVAQVIVDPARPPQALAAELRDDGGELVVRFDEPVQEGSPRVSLASGDRVTDIRVVDSGRNVVMRLAEPLHQADRLLLAGFRDRAQHANEMVPATLRIEPPTWPSSRRGLVFLWRTGDAPNLVASPDTDLDIACTLDPVGAARLDHAWRIVLGEGIFEATPEASARIRQACQATNTLSIEMVVSPPANVNSVPLLRTRGGYSNLGIGLDKGRVELTLLTGSPRRKPYEHAVLMALPEGRASHLALTYSPGRLVGYLDGERVVQSDAIQGDLFHWRDQALLVGGDASAGAGTLEGLAIYGRVLATDEIAEDAMRYRALSAQRSAVPRTVVDATLSARSRIPTLREITPYRRGLVVFTYRVDRVLQGEAPRTIRVAHWAILDGETQPVTERATGSKARLTLEPFAANPQLKSLYLGDTLDNAAQAPLYYSVAD